MTLRLKIANYTPPDEFEVFINGKELPIQSRRTRAVFIMNNDTWVSYAVPDALLQLGDNRLEVVVRKLNPQISATPELKNVEVLVEYDKGLGEATL